MACSYPCIICNKLISSYGKWRKWPYTLPSKMVKRSKLSCFFSSTNGIRLPQHILLKYLCFKTQINFVFAQFVQQLGFDRHLDQSVTNNMDCHLPFKRQWICAMTMGQTFWCPETRGKTCFSAGISLSKSFFSKAY